MDRATPSRYKHPKMSPMIRNVAEYLNPMTAQATSRPSVVRVPFTAEIAFSRGILNGDVIQRASCLFTAARETSPEGYAEEVAPAMYAISTYGEGYSIHCRGKPEIRQHM